MILKEYISGPIEANNYLLVDEETKEGALIDCSEMKQEIVDDANALGANIKYILLTHGHFDHVLGVNEMKKAFGAKVYIHKSDVFMLENINQIMSLFGMNQKVEPPEYDELVEDGQELPLGNTKIKILHTPGHSEGGVCYLVDDKLFSGDTLFRESVGRTDLYGGNFKTLLNSVKGVLFNLDDDINVYPGHGPSSTIGHEKNYNQFI